MVTNKLKLISRINLILGFCFMAVFIVFLTVGFWTIEFFFSAFAVTLPYIILSYISSIKIKVYPVLPFLLNILLVILLSLGTGKVKLTVFLIVPLMISMYYGSRKLNIAVIIFNILIYLVVPLTYSFRIKNPMPQLILLPILSLLPYACEVISVVALSRSFIKDSTQIQQENKVFMEEVNKKTNVTVETYKTIIKARNFYFSKHIENVEVYTEIILNELEKLPEYKDIITPEYKRSVLNGAVLHDIGKLNLSDDIINRFVFNDENNIDEIKLIPTRGYEIFQTFNPGSFGREEKQIIENIITQHQELLNGTGYPKHLFNRQISLEAQIVAIADYIDSGLMYMEGYNNKEFNSVYMELITKGYEAYNQTIVNLIYERRMEIIDYSKKCNSEIKSYLAKL